MKLTGITPARRKIDKLGEAVNYRLEIDKHASAKVGDGNSVIVYLSDSAAMELHDTMDAALTVARDTMLALLWSELDSVVDRLYSDPMTLDDLAQALEDGQSPPADKDAARWLSWGEDRGKAQGLAYAIAVLLNPRNPDVEAVRAEVATRRAG